MIRAPALRQRAYHGWIVRRAAIDRRTTALLLIAAAILALAFGIASRWAMNDARNPDFPDGTLWVCGNTDCGREFTLRLDEVASFYQANPEAQMTCPHCGQPSGERAQRCGVCSRAVSRALATAARACPQCKSPFGRSAP